MSRTSTAFEQALDETTIRHKSMGCHRIALHRAINKHKLDSGGDCLSPSDIDREMVVRGYRVLFDVQGRPCWRGVGLRGDRSKEYHQPFSVKDEFVLDFSISSGRTVNDSVATDVQVMA